jgi:hypothetical protein
LIVEAEALVALYLQGVVEETFAAAAETVRDFAAAAAIADRFAEFGLAIVNHSRPGDEAIVHKLAAACPAIVLCTGGGDLLPAGSLKQAIRIAKPFTEDDLIAACRQALAGAAT